MEKDNLQNTNFTSDNEAADNQRDLTDDSIDNKNDQVAQGSGLAAKIVALVIVGIFALALLGVFIYAFGVNPVTKLKLNLLLFDNCQININADVLVRHYQGPIEAYREKTIHYELEKIHIEGNAYAVVEPSDYHPNMYDYYEIDGDSAYQYVYTGYRWEKVELEDSSITVSGDEDYDNLFAIILNPKNFSRVLEKPNVWRAKYDIVQKYKNLEVKHEKGQYIYSWEESDVTFYLIFDSFGQTKVNLPNAE